MFKITESFSSEGVIMNSDLVKGVFVKGVESSKENFKVIDENEKNIGGRGQGRRYGLSENENSLISVQTIHLDFYEKFNKKKYDNEIAIQKMFKELCKNK